MLPNKKGGVGGRVELKAAAATSGAKQSRGGGVEFHGPRKEVRGEGTGSPVVGDAKKKGRRTQLGPFRFSNFRGKGAEKVRLWEGPSPLPSSPVRGAKGR